VSIALGTDAAGNLLPDDCEQTLPKGGAQHRARPLCREVLLPYAHAPPIKNALPNLGKIPRVAETNPGEIDQLVKEGVRRMLN
jgi:hypothetical protein